MSQHASHGTSLTAVLFACSVGSISYLKAGAVSVKCAVIASSAAFVTAKLGSTIANRVEGKKLSVYEFSLHFPTDVLFIISLFVNPLIILLSYSTVQNFMLPAQLLCNLLHLCIDHPTNPTLDSILHKSRKYGPVHICLDKHYPTSSSRLRVARRSSLRPSRRR